MTSTTDQSSRFSDQPVDRCVCANVTFREMNAYVVECSAAGGPEASVDSLRAKFNCGAGCALCVPYVRAMLATGRVRFAVNDVVIQSLDSCASSAESIAPPPPL